MGSVFLVILIRKHARKSAGICIPAYGAKRVLSPPYPLSVAEDTCLRQAGVSSDCRAYGSRGGSLPGRRNFKRSLFGRVFVTGATGCPTLLVPFTG